MTRHERDFRLASIPPAPTRSALWQLIDRVSDAVALAGGASYVLHALNGGRQAGPQAPTQAKPSHASAAQEL